MGLSTHTNRTPIAHHHNHAMNEFIHPGSGVCPLNDWAVLAFDGPDATSFLQGQLTQDVASLAPDQARLGGYCSAKGRLMATGVLWRPQPDSICWAIPAALLPGLQKRLQMFVLRAKVKIRDADLPLIRRAHRAIPSRPRAGQHGQQQPQKYRHHEQANEQFDQRESRTC